jgi:hypothetical protein
MGMVNRKRIIYAIGVKQHFLRLARAHERTMGRGHDWHEGRREDGKGEYEK